TLRDGDPTMSDFLLELSKNPRARSLIGALGLPIPLPQPLKRERGPWAARPLTAAGADAFIQLPESLAAAFRAPGETFVRPAKKLDSLAEGTKLDALVFDASGVRDIKGLRAVYEFFQPLVSKLARSSRVVILGRAPEGPDAEAAAVQAALDGFVRSVAKEIGRLGATANLIIVTRGAERRLGPVVRFFLSARSAFVSAQPVVLTARAKAIDEPAFVRPLEKKIALVTGAARGIGEATAHALALEGAHVVCLDRPGDDGPTSQLARAIGGTALSVDIGDGRPAAKIWAALAPLGGIDIIVNNAGITRDKTLGRMKPEQWDSVLGINLAAVIHT